MFELMVFIPAALLCFKDLKAVSNSSVVKSESLMASLKDIKYSAKLFQTGRIFFAREGPTFVKNELNSVAICSAECNDFLLIFSALGKVLLFCFILLVISFIICHDLLVFLEILITFLCKNYFLFFLITYKIDFYRLYKFFSDSVVFCFKYFTYSFCF